VTLEAKLHLRLQPVSVDWPIPVEIFLVLLDLTLWEIGLHKEDRDLINRDSLTDAKCLATFVHRVLLRFTGKFIPNWIKPGC
jgi:hypothetical protein